MDKKETNFNYTDCVKQIIQAEKLLKRALKIINLKSITKKQGRKELTEDINFFLKEFHKK